MLEDVISLKERWFELYSGFSEHRRAMLATVAQWEWANGPRYDPRPFYFQREHPKGRLLRRIRTDNDRDFGEWKCGYDEREEVIISDDGNFETLYSFAEDYIELAIYHTYYRILRGVSRLYFEDSRPSYFLSLLIGGDPSEFQGDAQEVWQNSLFGRLNVVVYREDYHYSNSRLVLIKRKRWTNGWSSEKREELWEGEYHLNYLSNGSLETITSGAISTDYNRTVYRKRQPGETLESMFEYTQSKLIEVIPKIVEKAKFTEPLYCLQLLYVDGGLFPPRLYPGLESRRKRISENLDTRYVPNEVWATVWDSDEHENLYDPLPIEDEETLVACERLQLEVSFRGSLARLRRGVKALRYTARILNQLDWSKYAPITSDFIVFTIDQEDISMALRLSGASRDQIADWRKRGLL